MRAFLLKFCMDVATNLVSLGQYAYIANLVSNR